MASATAKQTLELTEEWLRERYVVQKRSSQQIADECGRSSQYVRDRLRDNGIALRLPGAGNKAGDIMDVAALRCWIDEGLSADEIAERSGYSRTGVYKLLRKHGLTVRNRSTAPDDEQELLAEITRLYRDERLSLAAIGARYGRGAAWARSRVGAAGVATRPCGRSASAARTPDALRRYVADGRSVDEIAELVGRTPTTVREWLHDFGLAAPRPQLTPRPSVPPLDAEVLRQAYVDHRLTIAEVAEQLQVSADRVHNGLVVAGIDRRQPGTRTDRPAHTPISREQLHEMYVMRGLTCAAIAAELECSRSRVLAALCREDIPRRRGPTRVPVFDVDADTLRRLYVEDRLDDTAIGQRYGVPAHRVRQRLRQLAITRPASTPPHPDPPAPPRRVELERRYVHAGATLEQIARERHTSKRVVRGWLLAAGIPVRERTSRRHRKVLDVATLRELYETREWTAAEIAAELDTTVQLVLRALHDNRIPVRPGGPRRRLDVDDAERLLDRLYTDPDVESLLRRHDIPRRWHTGSIAERFPLPIALSQHLLRDAYVELGLTARHIELLTGQPAGQVLDELHALAIPVRTASLSPWLQRQRQQMAQPRGHAG